MENQERISNSDKPDHQDYSYHIKDFLLENYRGKWVAVRSGVGVIESDDTLRGLSLKMENNCDENGNLNACFQAVVEDQFHDKAEVFPIFLM